MFKKSAAPPPAKASERIDHSPRAGRADEVAGLLDGAKAVLAGLEAELPPLILDAVSRKPEAAERLSAHRDRVDQAKRAVAELQMAQSLAARLDREAVAEQNARSRADQLAVFKSCMAKRDAAVKSLMSAAATMSSAFGDYLNATDLAKGALPAGVTFPYVGVGPLGLGGRGDGPLDLLILAELHRLAPLRRADTNDFAALPFARPLHPGNALKPSSTPAGLDEYRAAAEKITMDIESQIRALDVADLTEVENMEASAA
ncbi:hypothetical protein [Bradyrhizobium sp. ISRA464]|uniref:hypothetical protein n=1 Tax=Bradyrhizobium sp. ISRA464 TaxID=2866200 RepID=UPI0024786A6A|nr:hypothetical protein [Bradyrhizobium sp. ISRA464]WGS30386.1 hypothetical protein MTX19_15885 [Bradyrhizobium sp. ISRA464]